MHGDVTRWITGLPKWQAQCEQAVWQTVIKVAVLGADAKGNSMRVVMEKLSQTLSRLHEQGQSETGARCNPLYSFPLQDVTYRLKQQNPQPVQKKAAIKPAAPVRRSGRNTKPPKIYTGDGGLSTSTQRN